MKKILSLILVAIMLLSIVPTAFAASTPAITVTADKASVAPGTVVTFTVSVSANSKIVALTHVITYNTSEFEYVADSAVSTDANMGPQINANTAGRIIYAAATSGVIGDSKHSIYTFKLKAKKQTGTVSASVTEAYVNTTGKDTDVTSAVNAASTKKISFSAQNDYFDIRKPSITTIRCKDSIVLHADAKKTLPSGSKIVWSTNNNKFKTSANGNNFTITSESNGNTVITATLYSSSGSVLESETIEMTSKAGFFDKIGGFFRNLFGTTKTYES